MEDTRENHELKRIAPTLFAMERRDPFAAPEGFFERFPHDVQAAIVARNTRRGWQVWPLFVRRIAVALPMLALLAGAWWYIARITQPVVADLSTTPSIDELSWSEEHDLLASLEEELEAMPAADLDLSEQELAAYVDNQGIDLTDLLTEQ